MMSTKLGIHRTVIRLVPLATETIPSLYIESPGAEGIVKVPLPGVVGDRYTSFPMSDRFTVESISTVAFGPVAIGTRSPEAVLAEAVPIAYIEN